MILSSSKPMLEKLNYSSVRFVFCQEIIIKCIHIFNHLLHTWKNVVLRSCSLFLTWQVTQSLLFMLHMQNITSAWNTQQGFGVMCYTSSCKIFLTLPWVDLKITKVILQKWWKCHKRGAGISYLPLVKMVLRREQEAFYGTGSLMSSN